MGPLSVADPGVADLLRDLAPTVLGVLARRHRDDFEACEDALQEALLAAAGSWPSEGVPANPTGWLVTTASRRLVEAWRRDAARRRREENDLRRAVEVDPVPDEDDTLALLVLCAHPVLTPPAQVALTLRAVGGLTTAEIARGLLTPEATVAQRISRAKARIAAAGARFAPPTAAELAVRIPIVLEVLYRVFTEGHTASSGDELQRGDLTAEALRLARRLHASVPGHGEATGLLALMLLTEARRAARSRPDGSLVPLAEQDRARWDAVAIAEGVGLLEGALPYADPGPYQVQAAIAAVHAEAGRAEDTDWEQILGLYGALEALAPGPMVTLNRLVALSMVDGPDTALLRLDALGGESGGDLAGHHRVDAVRAHLLERLDRHAEAAEAYRRAARTTLSAPEQRYLAARAARLDPGRSA